jgi:eukaryotic-like serine/threonine-protein kinase
VTHDRAWETDTWGFAEGDVIAPGRHAISLLGGGRRYEAYLVWDDTLHALVVVKVVRPEQTGDADTLAGMAGEAEALARLAHPSLVRCFDAVLDGERPHLVLELLDGPRLSTLERRYGVVVEQLLPLALQLCSALHYMARRGYAHLDVKPRNIIMSSTPKLIDLSVARTFDGARRTRLPIGTDAYMAPEQCDPLLFGTIDERTDVWGLGVTLYEALAGRRPFPPGDERSAELRERFPQVAHAPDPFPDDVLPPPRGDRARLPPEGPRASADGRRGRGGARAAGGASPAPAAGPLSARLDPPDARPRRLDEEVSSQAHRGLSGPGYS